MATKVGDLYMDFGGKPELVGTASTPLDLGELKRISDSISKPSDIVKMPTGDFVQLKTMLREGQIAFRLKPIVAAHDFNAAMDRLKALFDGDFDGRCEERCGRMAGCTERCSVLSDDHAKPRVGPFHIFRQHECQS